MTNANAIADGAGAVEIDHAERIAMATIRVSGGIYDRDKPGWVQDPNHASRGTYETVPVFTVDGECGPTFAVIRHGEKLFTVVQVATGLAVPAGFPGLSAAPKLYPHSLTQFRIKSAARAFMSAVAGSGILATDREPSKDELLALKDWLSATYPNPATDRPPG